MLINKKIHVNFKIIPHTDIEFLKHDYDWIKLNFLGAPPKDLASSCFKGGEKAEKLKRKVLID